MGAEVQTLEQCHLSSSKIYEFSKIMIKVSMDESSDIKEVNEVDLDTTLAVIVGHSETNIMDIIERKIYSMRIGTDVEICFRRDNCSSEWIQIDAEEMSDTELLKLHVHLISIESGKPISQVGTSEKFERARIYKELGTTLFKSGNIPLAFSKYKRALQYLILIQKHIDSDCPEAHGDYLKLRLQCYLNLAACQGSSQAWDHVIVNCSKALDIEGSNIKALYRRARAYEQKKEYDLAIDDLERALEEEPTNTAFQNFLANVKQRVRTQNASLAQGLSKMFS